MAKSAGGNYKFDSELAAHALIGVAEHFGRLILEHPDRFTAQRLAAGVARVFRAYTS